MIYFEYDETGRITLEHYQPEALGKTKEELMSTGILIDSADVPTPDFVEGKRFRLYVDVETKTLVYDYVDAPPKPEPKEDIASLADYVLALDYRLTLQELIG